MGGHRGALARARLGSFPGPAVRSHHARGLRQQAFTLTESEIQVTTCSEPGLPGDGRVAVGAAAAAASAAGDRKSHFLLSRSQRELEQGALGTPFPPDPL